MIRPATESDIPPLLALIRELAAYENLSDQCIATEGLLREHLFGPGKSADAIVTEIPTQDAGAKIVGYAIFFKTFSTFLGRPGLYLEDIYIQPAQRNRGLGKAMLRHLAQLCIEKNYARLEWTCLDWNTPSLNFYQSLGAANLKQWHLHRLTGDALEQFATT